MKVIRSMSVGPSKMVYVFDLTRRLFVFHADGRFARSVPMVSPVTSSLVLEDGTILVNAHLRTAEEAGLPLHLFSAAGDKIRSFGAEDPQVNSAAPDLQTRHITSCARGVVWTVGPAAYVLEQWSIDGSLITRIDRRGAPFPPARDTAFTPAAPHPRTEAAVSHIRGLSCDAAGNLWVARVVPDPGWRSQNLSIGEGVTVSSEDFDKLYDTIVDVVDPRTKRLIASARFPFYVVTTFGRSSIVRARSASRATPVLELLDLTLSRRP
jgi:hypothetical protein